MLTESLSMSRDILNYINRQVDEHEKEQRLFDIYNKLDARSSTIVMGKKFKVSEIDSGLLTLTNLFWKVNDVNDMCRSRCPFTKDLPTLADIWLNFFKLKTEPGITRRQVEYSKLGADPLIQVKIDTNLPTRKD